MTLRGSRVGGWKDEMQKLEEVLRAEEAARHAVSDAHERGVALVREAEASAKQAVVDARESAARDAARIRDDLMGRAAQQAAALESASQSALEETGRVAQARIPRAASAALDELLG
jgi:vacuolar-type H+-ATPase subunit H